MKKSNGPLLEESIDDIDEVTPTPDDINEVAPFSNDTYRANLLRISDDLYEVLALYSYHCFAFQELSTDIPEQDDGKFSLGMMLTRQWLEERGDKLMSKIDKLREPAAEEEG